jgi:hypothetical protein
MPSETRSLWEQLDSDVEPWRRGRVALTSIGIFYLLLQSFSAYQNIKFGNLEALIGFAAFCAVFWLQFYLIWIGVNWIRWLAGAWLGLSGFCFLIWALRDGDLVLGAAGATSLLIATYFCLSPFVYFFARQQRENRSWLHSGMVVAAFVFLSFTFFMGAVGLLVYRAHAQAAAIEFTQEAAEHIYGEQDRDWMFAHLSPMDLAASTSESLNVFFVQNVGRLGPVPNFHAHRVGPGYLSFSDAVYFSSAARRRRQKQLWTGARSFLDLRLRQGLATRPDVVETHLHRKTTI